MATREVVDDSSEQCPQQAAPNIGTSVRGTASVRTYLHAWNRLSAVRTPIQARYHRLSTKRALPLVHKTEPRQAVLGLKTIGELRCYDYTKFARLAGQGFPPRSFLCREPLTVGSQISFQWSCDIASMSRFAFAWCRSAVRACGSLGTKYPTTIPIAPSRSRFPDLLS